MKRKKLYFVWMFFIFASVFSFVSCSDKKTVPDFGSGGSSEGDISSGGSAEEDTFYTVLFDSDGGTEVDSITVKANCKIPAFPTPTKMNKSYIYEFSGWYYDGELWDFETDTVQGDITLVAKWELSERYTAPVYP
ncbi:MAG: InlB B-repeat-containing protein [Candidatus Scatosoma sp.]